MKKSKLLAFLLTVILILGVLSPMVLAAPVGTTPSNPVEVVMGETYSWSWTKDTDHLYCYNRFTVDQTGFIHFRVDKLYDDEGEMGRYYIDLYDEEGNIVSASRCYYSRDLPKQYYDFYVGLKPGTYFLNLKPGFYVKSGSFTATYSFSFDAANCEQEPNESKASANPLVVDQWMEAYYGNDGASYDAEVYDWFRYNMVKGNKYRIYLKNFAKIQSTTVIYSVISPSGDSLYRLTEDSYASTDYEGNTYWDYVAEETGTYYFRFSNYRHEQFKYAIMVSDPSHVHAWQVDYQVSAPTCTASGSISYYCSGCGASKLESTPALGHDYVTTSVIKEATYYEEGLAEQTCSRCSATATNAIPRKVLFSDVTNTGAYYFEPVLWAVNNGITAGTSSTTFSPEQGCTRAQVVTFLWRAAGKPEPTSSNNPFGDVKESNYYYKAVLWAVEKGITNGISKTSFAPEATCTRGQIVTFLWRFEGKPAPANRNNPFSDVSTSAYYSDAVLWAVENGVTNGMSKTSFAPESTCTRAQIVTFLYRDIEK